MRGGSEVPSNILYTFTMTLNLFPLARKSAQIYLIFRGNADWSLLGACYDLF